MEQLLRLMADGEFHAGEELGGLLNVSRAAIWKQIKKLHGAGIDVQSVKGKGYRLSHPVELLDEAQIKAQSENRAKQRLRSLDVHFQTTSTNNVAMSMASSGAGSGSVCLAEQQTAGRGRRGRKWVSPLAVNLYLSCVWEFYRGAAALEGLSLATGVAIADALERFGVQGLKLKWPNDVLFSGSKLAGILLEMTGDPLGRCQVILGVGINHYMSKPAALEIDQQWVSLDSICKGIGRNALAARIISHLLIMLEQFEQQGFEPFRHRWQSLDAFKERPVVIKTGASDLEGIADGVDETGGLRLLTQGGLEIIKGGEVSLRGLE